MIKMLKMTWKQFFIDINQQLAERIKIQNNNKSQPQLESLEEQSSIDLLKIALKEFSFNNKRMQLNYQKNLGSEQHNI